MLRFIFPRQRLASGCENKCLSELSLVAPIQCIIRHQFRVLYYRALGFVTVKKSTIKTAA